MRGAILLGLALLAVPAGAQIPATPAGAQTLVATRTLKAQSIIGPGDVVAVAAVIPGTLSDPGDVLGQEARVTLFAGRPIRPGDVGPPASVERNQIVVLRFQAGGLDILAEGRALARGGTGDVIRVINQSSRNTVSGLIDADGTVRVGPAR